MADAQQQQVDTTIQNPDVVTKYKTAAEISTRMFQIFDWKFTPTNTLPFSPANRDLDLIIVVFCLLGVLNQVIPLCVAGAKVIDVCIEGDKLIREATKTVYNKGKTPKGKFIFS